MRKSIKVNLSSWKNIKTYLFICLPSGIKILLFSDLFDFEPGLEAVSDAGEVALSTFEPARAYKNRAIM